jgi:hypothetical protein
MTSPHASSITPETFSRIIANITSTIDTQPLNQQLEEQLNRVFPAGGTNYQAILQACRTAIQAGWMCNREAGGIRYGRVLKPSAATHGFSVDVVDMQPVVGPHHAHPNGEVDLIMPLETGAEFDGHGAGWLVYGPGSAHNPTVKGGRTLVLYLLPAGAIEFTRS